MVISVEIIILLRNTDNKKASFQTGNLHGSCSIFQKKKRKKKRAQSSRYTGKNCDKLSRCDNFKETSLPFLSQSIVS